VGTRTWKVFSQKIYEVLALVGLIFNIFIIITCGNSTVVKSRASNEEVLSLNPVYYFCNIAFPKNILTYILNLVTALMNYLFSKHFIHIFGFIRDSNRRHVSTCLVTA
jgi:hypothetical protein